MTDTDTTTTGGRRTRPYAPRMAPEDRREQLLDAVLRVIVTQGVHKVSMDSVAREAQVTRPVVYSHFSDSDDLLRASLAREEDGALTQLADALPQDRDTSPAEAAVSALERFLAAVVETPDRWRAAYSLVDSSTPLLRSRVELGRQLAISAVEDLVRWAVEERADAETDVEMLARAVFALFWDAGRLVLAEPETFPATRIVAFGRRSIERYVGPS